ncbi:MAG: hypothetical protein ACRC6T_11695 [Sarcina sp.]
MNEFYYYDGESFQKCLTLNNTKVPINKDYNDLAFFTVNAQIETFLTLGKIENKCLYDLNNTKAHFHILTDRGFELVTTEAMNVRAAGLDTKDFVDILVKPVLVVSIEEIFNINKLNELKNIDTYETVNPVVRVVPRSDITDIFKLGKLDLSKILLTNENAVITFINNINTEVIEVINLKRTNLNNLTNTENIKILLNEKEI